MQELTNYGQKVDNVTSRLFLDLWDTFFNTRNYISARFSERICNSSQYHPFMSNNNKYSYLLITSNKEKVINKLHFLSKNNPSCNRLTSLYYVRCRWFWFYPWNFGDLQIVTNRDVVLMTSISVTLI